MTGLGPPPLDATLYTNDVIASDGVTWTPTKVTTSHFDSNTMNAIVLAVEAALGTPSPLRGGWASCRTSAIGTQILTGLYQVPLVTPFELRTTTTIDDIGIGVTSAGGASAVIRLGITDTNSTGTPVNFQGGGGTGAGAHDFGTVTAASTGEKHVGAAQFGTPLVLTPGRYHAVACWQVDNSVDPTIRAFTSDEYGLSGGSGAPPAGAVAGFQGSTTASGAFGTTLGGVSATLLAFGPRILLHAA